MYNIFRVTWFLWLMGLILSIFLGLSENDWGGFAWMIAIPISLVIMYVGVSIAIRVSPDE